MKRPSELWSPFLFLPSPWDSTLVPTWLRAREEEDWTISSATCRVHVSSSPLDLPDLRGWGTRGQYSSSGGSATHQLHPGRVPEPLSKVLLVQISRRKTWDFWAMALRKPSVWGPQGWRPGDSGTHLPVRPHTAGSSSPISRAAGLIRLFRWLNMHVTFWCILWILKSLFYVWFLLFWPEVLGRGGGGI